MTRRAGDDGAEGPGQPGASGTEDELAYLEARTQLEAFVRAYLKLCDYRPPPPCCGSDWGFDVECS
jgi:hypothetical protein